MRRELTWRIVLTIVACLALVCLSFSEAHEDLHSWEYGRDLAVNAVLVGLIAYAVYPLVHCWSMSWLGWRRFLTSPYWYLVIILHHSITFALSTGEAGGADPVWVLLNDSLNVAQFGLLLLAASKVFSHGFAPLNRGSLGRWTFSYLAMVSANLLALIDTMSASAELQKEWLIDNVNSLILSGCALLLVLVAAWRSRRDETWLGRRPLDAAIGLSALGALLLFNFGRLGGFVLWP